MRALAGDRDPLEAVAAEARALVLQAVDLGWRGPPYDPFELARILEVPVRPSNLRVDARTVVDDAGTPVIEYNPNRPAARVRFSVAHEVGHLLFPDVAEQVRRRTAGGAMRGWTQGDDWQLELLCNVAAAEILMPSQTLAELGVDYMEIDHLMGVRAHLQVSVEALLRRIVSLADQPVTMFAAHRQDDRVDEVPTIDYASHSLAGPASPDPTVPADTGLRDCTAIGHTVSVDETWDGETVRVEAVAVSPYPGQHYPRIVGLLHQPTSSVTASSGLLLREVVGDIFPLRHNGKQMLLHLVTDGARRWYGAFARRLAHEAPGAAKQYEDWARARNLPFEKGQAVLLDSLTEPAVCCLVAQEGYGPSVAPRIRYPALARALDEAANHALTLGAEVHAPAIGTGQAGGHWPIIRDQIDRSFARRGVPVTIHHLEAVW